MITSFARIRTLHARDYLTFLANAAQRYDRGGLADDGHALLQLKNGICEVAASDRFLEISITADSISDATTLEELVSDCLDGAAGARELHYQWIIAPVRSSPSLAGGEGVALASVGKRSRL